MIVVRFGLVIAVMIAALFLVVAGRSVDTPDRVLGRNLYSPLRMPSSTPSGMAGIG